MHDDDTTNPETGDDLSETLNESGETEFVAEEPKGSNRGTVVLGALVLAAVGGMYVMHLRSGPASAAAAPAAVANAKTIDSFLSDGRENLRAMQTMLKSTQKVVQQFTSYPTMTQIPLADLKTNPFRFAPSKGDETADQTKAKREEQRTLATAAVKKLQLQSIVAGAQKACLINNAMYCEGQTVDGFYIEKIDGDAVIVRSGIFRFAIRIVR
jgi:hypothetical protein